jgi:hypothetical protein
MKPPAPTPITASAGSGSGSAETVPVQDMQYTQDNVIRSESSDSISSSSSNCLAQADSHSRGLEDRTDRESIISSRFSATDG